MQQLNELEQVEDLARALEESDERAVLLFKHSLTCPISTRAFNEFKAFLEQCDSPISCHLITVQTARAVSDRAADILHLAHQSPQAILVKNGRGVWSASHFEITAAALRQAVTGDE